MEHYFALPVQYKGEERSFSGRLVTFAYSYKFYLMVDNNEIVFERDDEREFRVLDESGNQQTIDPGLLEAIVLSLQKLA